MKINSRMLIVLTITLMSAVTANAACLSKAHATFTGVLRSEAHRHPTRGIFHSWVVHLDRPTCAYLHPSANAKRVRVSGIRRIQVITEWFKGPKLTPLKNRRVRVRASQIMERTTAWHVTRVIAVVADRRNGVRPIGRRSK